LGQLPAYNTGALVTEINEFIFDDAAIIACLLRQWDIPAAMIGTTVGDDARGHSLAKQLKAWGVQGEVRHSRENPYPLGSGYLGRDGRTYRIHGSCTPEVLITLDTADLSLLDGAGFLYVDWYDGDHILRAMDKAHIVGHTVFSEF